MFDEIVKMVKDQIGNNPEVASSLPEGEKEAVSHEVAAQITQGLAQQAPQQGGIGGLLNQLQHAAGSGSPVVNAIEGGVLGSIGSKFGLSPAVTGEIAAALPVLLHKLAHKANDPNDNRITHDSLSESLSKIGMGGLGNLFNRH